MLKCKCCGSTEIIETEDYQAWFREGTMLRNRTVSVWRDGEMFGGGERWFANCPEKSLSAVSKGATQLEALLALGKPLEGMGMGVMLGSRIVEDENGSDDTDC
jgi:hypothetical protein